MKHSRDDATYVVFSTGINASIQKIRATLHQQLTAHETIRTSKNKNRNTQGRRGGEIKKKKGGSGQPAYNFEIPLQPEILLNVRIYLYWHGWKSELSP